MAGSSGAGTGGGVTAAGVRAAGDDGVRAAGDDGVGAGRDASAVDTGALLVQRRLLVLAGRDANSDGQKGHSGSSEVHFD